MSKSLNISKDLSSRGNNAVVGRRSRSNLHRLSKLMKKWPVKVRTRRAWCLTLMVLRKIRKWPKKRMMQRCKKTID